MYFIFDETSNLESLKNYLITFGFFSQKRNITKNNIEEMQKTAKKIFLEKQGKNLEHLPITESLFEGSIWENYKEVQDFFLKPDVKKMLETTLGKNYLYVGSDLSVFSSLRVQSWHRDWMLRQPVIKIGYYLLENGIQGGELRYIPGSHIVNDTFSKLLQKAALTPDERKMRGGMNEDGFFPLNKIYNEFIDDTALCELPHTAINIKNNDEFVYFDLRGFHCGTVSNPPARRILFSGIFTINPFDETVDLKNMGIKETPEQLANDLGEILWLDRIGHKIKYTYDKNGKMPDMPENNLVEINFEENEESISFFNKKDFKLKLLSFESKNKKYSDAWVKEYFTNKAKIYFKL